MSDKEKKTRIELTSYLEKIAEEWRNAPYLSNEHSEAVRYHAAKNELEEMHGLKAHIIADKHATDYQVKFIN